MSFNSSQEICFMVNSLCNGGAERIAILLAEEFVHNMIGNVNLILLEKDVFYKPKECLNIIQLSARSVGRWRILKAFDLLILAIRLKNYVNENNVAIVQSHLYRANFINVLARLFGARHEVQIVNHSSLSRFLSSGLAGWANFYLVKLLYNRAEKLVFLSIAMKDDFTRHGVHARSHFVINNPYDIDDIIFKSREPLENRSWIESDNIILCVGRLIALKRCMDVIMAFERIHDVLPDAILVFVGEGVDRCILEEYVAEHKLENRILFLGQVNNPYKYMSAAKVFILASETEGFPNVIIESLSCGTPVIATDCVSGPREILAPDTKHDIHITEGIEYAEYGILVPVGSVASISQAMLAILTDDALFSSYKQKTIHRASKFHKKIIIKQYESMMFGNE